ncbi:MAG: hypothetical protein ACRCXZ_05355 [Patescibacteria group bacterium]
MLTTFFNASEVKFQIIAFQELVQELKIKGVTVFVNRDNYSKTNKLSIPIESVDSLTLNPLINGFSLFNVPCKNGKLTLVSFQNHWVMYYNDQSCDFIGFPVTISNKLKSDPMECMYTNSEGRSTLIGVKVFDYMELRNLILNLIDYGLIKTKEKQI